MCGIVGQIHGDTARLASSETVNRMLAVLRHRGPDEEGIYCRGPAGLGHTRLAIIDLASGRQPISNEDGSLWIVFNGEIFNFQELKAELVQRGHRFKTNTDTEVIVHLYEDRGADCLDALNGQFAFAIYDFRRHECFLARDRFGIHPLFYTVRDGTLYFASEIKALLTLEAIPRRLDPRGIDHLFTFSTIAAPRTAFEGISALPAGHSAVVRDGEMTVREYWDLAFAPPEAALGESPQEIAQRIRALLEDAVRLRLVSDVPLGVYLSGGIDSSLIGYLMAQSAQPPLRSFSIAFTDKFYDERAHSREIAAWLKTDHVEIECDYRHIAEGFPRLVWHAETPFLSTESVPLMWLSQEAKKAVTVVLTGEGSDEAFAGYYYFKVDRLRRLLQHGALRWAGGVLRRAAPSGTRDYFFAPPSVRERLEGQYGCFPAGMLEFQFFEAVKRLIYAPSMWDRLGGFVPIEEVPIDREQLKRLDPLAQSLYYAYKIRLANFLLTNHGDRVTMANAVEGRYPYLDHRLVEYVCQIPSRYKLRRLTEKFILRQAFKREVPPMVWARKKKMYMAPFLKSFLVSGCDYVDELLSERVIRQKGYFNPHVVRDMVRSYRTLPSGARLFECDLAVIGVLSVHLLDELFIQQRPQAPQAVAPARSWQPNHAPALA